MEPGEPLPGKKHNRREAAASADAMSKRRSPGEEPADYAEASASSGDDGEWCGRSSAEVVDDGREDEEEEEAFERELDAWIREAAKEI